MLSANLGALFAVFLLGWRFFHPLAGWTAAIFFALDGYFIGFSRIVQYQSIVFLVSILVVLILYRLVTQPKALVRYLTLASILLATGLLSHYEATLAVLPAAFPAIGLGAAESNTPGLRSWVQQSSAVWSGLCHAGGLLRVRLCATPTSVRPYTYLADRRMGGAFPYNNLADFFLRTTVYSTTYYVMLADRANHPRLGHRVRARLRQVDRPGSRHTVQRPAAF